MRSKIVILWKENTCKNRSSAYLLKPLLNPNKINSFQQNNPNRQNPSISGNSLAYKLSAKWCHMMVMVNIWSIQD